MFDEIFYKEWGFEADSYARGFYKNDKIIYLSIEDYKNTSHCFKKEDYLKAYEGFKKTL